MSELTSYIVSNPGFLYGVAVGWALANIPKIVCFVFHQAIRVPFLRSAILSDPARSKAIIAQIQAELDKDIDQEAAAQAQPKP